MELAKPYLNLSKMLASANLSETFITFSALANQKVACISQSQWSVHHILSCSQSESSLHQPISVKCSSHSQLQPIRKWLASANLSEAFITFSVVANQNVACIKNVKSSAKPDQPESESREQHYVKVSNGATLVTDRKHGPPNCSKYTNRGV